MLTSRPAARAALTFLQFLLGAANATVSGDLLLGVLDPADELVAGQGRDVVPGVTCGGVGDERLAQVAGQLVHHATGQSRAVHEVKVVGPGRFAGSSTPAIRRGRDRAAVLADPDLGGPILARAEQPGRCVNSRQG